MLPSQSLSAPETGEGEEGRRTTEEERGAEYVEEERTGEGEGEERAKERRRHQGEGAQRYLRAPPKHRWKVPTRQEVDDDDEGVVISSGEASRSEGAVAEQQVRGARGGGGEEKAQEEESRDVAEEPWGEDVLPEPRSEREIYETADGAMGPAMRGAKEKLQKRELWFRTLQLSALCPVLSLLDRLPTTVVGEEEAPSSSRRSRSMHTASAFRLLSRRSLEGLESLRQSAPSEREAFLWEVLYIIGQHIGIGGHPKSGSFSQDGTRISPKL